MPRQRNLRGRKPGVDKKLRRDWYRLWEEEGKTPPEIARDSGYDVRTVRNYLHIEEEERQQKQATLSIYRDALQNHYRDLTGLIEKFGATVKKGDPIILDPEADPMITALREHLKRSPLWDKIDRWNKHLNKIENLKQIAQERIKKTVENDPRIKNLAKNTTQTRNSLIRVLALQFDKLAHNSHPLTLGEDFIIEPKTDDNGLIQPRYGAYWFDFMIKKVTEKLKIYIAEYESEIKQWEELKDMQHLLEDDQPKKDLTEDLNLIIYRRVIPGKCRYCPF